VAEAQADKALFQVLEAQLRQLLTGPFQDRRAVAQVCGAYLALPGAKRGAWSLEMLEALATDKTPNVRMAVAAVLAKHRWAGDSPGWLALKNDADFDVRYCATGEWVPPAQRKPKQKGEITANMASLAAATPDRRRIDSKEMQQFADSASLIPQMKNQEL
jgi:hypothetical protein